MPIEAVSFKAVLDQYDKRFKSIIGITTLREEQVQKFIALLNSGKLYAGSDGSEKDGRGSHVYGFKNRDKEGEIWRGSAMIPGSKTGMSSLRAEHDGAIGILLILFAIQIFMWGKYDHSQ